MNKSRAFRNSNQSSGIFLAILLSLSFMISAQELEEDPLAGRKDISITTEVFVLWSQGPNTSIMNSNQKIYDYLAPFDTINFFPPDQRFTPYVRNEEVGDWGVFNERHMDVARGDFNEDGKDDVITAWEGPNRRINMMVPFIDPGTLTWSDAAMLFSTGPLMDGTSFGNAHIILETGDFDGDREDEFVLAYQHEDETIHLEVYDTDSTLVPGFRTTINDESLPELPYGLSHFAIGTADFNNDGRDEIIMAGRDPDLGGNGTWALYVKIYSVCDAAGNYQLQELVKVPVFNEPAYNVGPMGIRIAAADFDQDARPEIAMLFSFFQGQQTGDDTYLYLMDVDNDISQITFDNSNRATLNRIHQNEMEPLDLDTGDLNADGTQEIVFFVGGTVFVYESDTSRVPIYRTQTGGLGSGDAVYSRNFMSVTDFDRDLEEEIVVMRNFSQGSGSSAVQRFKMWAFEANSSLTNLEVKAIIDQEELTPGQTDTGRGRHYAMVAGDFDGDNLYVGKPKRYYESEIRQPLIILNSPPVHFDIIDGTLHDVNICYNGNACEHQSNYTQSVTTTGEMSTELSMDWGVDTTITGDAEAYGNTIKRSMSNSYGDGFTKDKTRRETFRINFSATAVTEDLLFGTVMDYVIWEYPVYAADTLRAYVAVVQPREPQKTWYSTEGWTGLSYVPNHEVGNIWSYQEYNNLTENDYLEESIKLDNNVRFQLSPTSFFTWGVDWSSWSNSSVSRRKSITSNTGFSWSAGLDIDFFGSLKSTYGEEMNSTYSENEISTHTTSVLEEIQVSVDLGRISDGEKRYDVTPYCYWAKNGALVVDYAVRPQLAPPGQPETWWQQVYGDDPDPAFILPFKYHPEKGWPLSEPAKRYQSRDIVFLPRKAEPGDTVSIYARINNFSLIDTQNPVKVRFYLGDPDDGGTALTGINGETEIFTENFMPTRGSEVVRFDWQMPQGTPNFPRIYAVIDPDNDITAEVHENNNKAFNVLGSDIATAIDIADLYNIKDYSLAQNYPNPFNPETVIRYSLSVNQPVTLKIFDILGREVRTLVKERQQVGAFQVTWDGRNDAGATVSSGIYFYRLTAGTFQQTRKMMLIR